ncbi:hypothetical protein ABID59_004822 [Bradyrhizobium sp. S3.3.6]
MMARTSSSPVSSNSGLADRSRSPWGKDDQIGWPRCRDAANRSTTANRKYGGRDATGKPSGVCVAEDPIPVRVPSPDQAAVPKTALA